MSYEKNLTEFKKSLKSLKKLRKENLLKVLLCKKQEKQENIDINMDLISIGPLYPLIETKDGFKISEKPISAPVQPILYSDIVDEFIEDTTDPDVNMLTMLGGMVVFHSQCILRDINNPEAIEFIKKETEKIINTIGKANQNSSEIIRCLQKVIEELFKSGLLVSDGVGRWTHVYPLEEYRRLLAPLEKDLDLFDAYRNINREEEVKNVGKCLCKAIQEVFNIRMKYQKENCIILDYWLLQFFLVYPDYYFYALEELKCDLEEVCDLGYELAYKISILSDKNSLISGRILDIKPFPTALPPYDYSELLPMSDSYSSYTQQVIIQKVTRLSKEINKIFESHDEYDILNRLCECLKNNYHYLNPPNPSSARSDILNAFDKLIKLTKDLMDRFSVKGEHVLSDLSYDINLSLSLFKMHAGIDIVIIPLFRGVEVLLRNTFMKVYDINEKQGSSFSPKNEKNAYYVNVFYPKELRNSMNKKASHITLGYKFNYIMDAKDDENNDYYNIAQLLQNKCIDPELVLLKTICRINDDKSENSQIWNKDGYTATFDKLRNVIIHKLNDFDIYNLTDDLLRNLIKLLKDAPGVLEALAEMNYRLHQYIEKMDCNSI